MSMRNATGPPLKAGRRRLDPGAAQSITESGKTYPITPPAQAELACSFPRWSPEAVIAEAARNWNLLHPSRPFDPAGGSWTFACIVIEAWLRHAVSNYDMVCTPENRSELQKEIKRRARLAYPWLVNKEIDPRGSGNAGRQPIVRPFDWIGHYLAELSSHRSAAMVALRNAKRKNERQDMQTLEAEISEADRQMQTLYRMVMPDKHGERDVFILHERGDYCWAGNRLSPNHLEPLPITCRNCAARLYRTKRPVNVGGGIYYHVVSCRCSMVFEARKWSIARYADEDGELAKLPPTLRLSRTNNPDN